MKVVTDMKRVSFGEGVVMFLVFIGVFYFIGAIIGAYESQCIKTGCNNKQAGNSAYCYVHKPARTKSSYGNSPHSGGSKSLYGTSKSSNYSSEKGTTTNSSYGNKAKSSSTKKNTTTKNSNSKKSTYEAYDDGYDDIYMDEDYDYDRYNRDSDYADGVDDAMDEFGDDW